MEIEKRAFVESLNQIAENLEELDFEEKETVNIEDRYFCRENVSSVEEVQMDDPGSYGLRTRQVNNESSAELNCKVIKNQGDHQAFIEHETQAESAKEVRKILNTIGFKEFCHLNKKRTKYVSNASGLKVTVNLEDFKDFPPVIEIEIIAEENIVEKKDQIEELMTELNVKKEDLIEKSITLLYFKENAEF